MANPDWGTKHFCKSCGAKYYDLNRSPAVCPKCGAAPIPDTAPRPRRSRPAAQAKDTVAAAPVPRSGDDAAELEEADPKIAAIDEDDKEIAALAAPDDDDKLIEDTSDLGTDDDVVADVVINGDDTEET